MTALLCIITSISIAHSYTTQQTSVDFSSLVVLSCVTGFNGFKISKQLPDFNGRGLGRPISPSLTLDPLHVQNNTQPHTQHYIECTWIEADENWQLLKAS